MESPPLRLARARWDCPGVAALARAAALSGVLLAQPEQRIPAPPKVRAARWELRGQQAPPFPREAEAAERPRPPGEYYRWKRLGNFLSPVAVRVA
jgi:hypothetical protein